MNRRGWVAGAATAVVLITGFVVWRLISAPAELRAMPDLCELASSPDVQALVPEADAVFTGSNDGPGPGNASCNVQHTEAAEYAALFVFASQSAYGAADDDVVEEECERIGASPGEHGPGDRMCLVSTDLDPGEKIDAVVYDDEFTVTLRVLRTTDNDLPNGEQHMEAVLQDVLDVLPRA